MMLFSATLKASRISKATAHGIRPEESFVYNKVRWELSELCSCTASLNLTRSGVEGWGRRHFVLSMFDS